MLTLFFKAQIFVALLPLLFLYSVLFYDNISLVSRFTFIAGCIGLAGLAILICSNFSSAPTFRFDGSGLNLYLLSISRTVTNDISLWIIDKLRNGSSFGQNLLQGSIILSGATYGLFILGYIFLLFNKIIKQKVHAFDWLPGITVIIYLIFALLLAPNTHGNRWEIQHRPFVWSYFIVAGYVGGRLICLVQNKRQRLNTKHFLFTIFVFTILFFLSCSSYFTNIQAPVTHTALFNKTIPKGLYYAALYIRDNSSYQDIVQDSKNDDPRAIIIGLTGRRAYLARPSAHKKNITRTKIVERRLQKLQKFKEASDSSEIRKIIAETKIRWYLLHPDSTVNWPDVISANPVFKSSGYKVYRFDF